MGEVYPAHGTCFGRDIRITVLCALFSADPERPDRRSLVMISREKRSVSSNRKLSRNGVPRT
jgi:hypothetical protein